MTARSESLLCDAGLGRLNQIQNNPAFLKISRTGRGQRQATGAARHQFHPKVLLQRCHLARDHRPRNAHLLRHRRETAEFGDPYKDMHGR